jgi:hypothetical protein
LLVRCANLTASAPYLHGHGLRTSIRSAQSTEWSGVCGCVCVCVGGWVCVCGGRWWMGWLRTSQHLLNPGQ